MKDRIVFFLLMTTGMFVGRYFILEDHNMLRVLLISLSFGLVIALLYGPMKRLIDYVIKKVLKRESH